MRIAVFGANGPTGRLLTGQALAAGHRVAAVTRQPGSFPLHHDRLEVVGADVLDPAAVDAAVAERDAVLSTLGVPAGQGGDQHLFAWSDQYRRRDETASGAPARRGQFERGRPAPVLRWRVPVQPGASALRDAGAG
ncbi:hypothetical protein GCM10029978_114500 [Actinoallomurus acanthiterrae]